MEGVRVYVSKITTHPSTETSVDLTVQRQSHKERLRPRKGPTVMF